VGLRRFCGFPYERRGFRCFFSVCVVCCCLCTCSRRLDVRSRLVMILAAIGGVFRASGSFLMRVFRILTRAAAALLHLWRVLCVRFDLDDRFA
jgi:hypothetical protein